MCVTPCVLINAEVSVEGPECILLVEGWEKLPSAQKIIKDKVKYSDVSNNSICKNYIISGNYKC
jgi:hypothetical protein